MSQTTLCRILGGKGGEGVFSKGRISGTLRYRQKQMYAQPASFHLISPSFTLTPHVLIHTLICFAHQHMHVHTSHPSHTHTHTQPHTYIRLTFTPSHTYTCPSHPSHPLHRTTHLHAQHIHTLTPTHPHTPTQLVLRDNDITVVPKEIYGCTKLKTLHLQVNQLNVLPPELSEHQCCLTRVCERRAHGLMEATLY